MKKKTSHAFVNQMLIYALVAIGAGGSVGVGTVWVRHQISVTANTNRELTKRIFEVNRQLNEWKARVAEERDPLVLQRRNTDWRLGLERMTDGQVVRAVGDPVQRLAADRERDQLLTDRAQTAISFNHKLALGN